MQIDSFINYSMWITPKTGYLTCDKSTNEMFINVVSSEILCQKYRNQTMTADSSS